MNEIMFTWGDLFPFEVSNVLVRCLLCLGIVQSQRFHLLQESGVFTAGRTVPDNTGPIKTARNSQRTDETPPPA